jgi:hypothetical protein
MLCRNSTYAIIAPTCIGKVISSRGCKNVCKIESGVQSFSFICICSLAGRS